MAAAEAKAAENRNSYLRAVAELENFRKRSEREIDNARKFAIERFAQELVTVGDALEAGHQRRRRRLPGRRCSRAPRRRLRQLHRAFDKAGIKIIDPGRASPSIRSGMRPWWCRRAASSRPTRCWR